MKTQLGDLAGNVIEERLVPIEMKVGCCEKKGCAKLVAGEIARITTRCLGEKDDICGHEETFYPPLVPLKDSLPAFTVESGVEGHAARAMSGPTAIRAAPSSATSRCARSRRRWRSTPKASARSESAVRAALTLLLFRRRRRVDAPAATFAAVAPAARGRIRSSRCWRSRPIRRRSCREDPEAFAKLLDPRGVRLTGADGKALCDVWLASEVALAAKPTTELQVELATIPFGTLISAHRSRRRDDRYRNQAIAPGCCLRTGWQPSDGNHLGTSSSRDFAVVTELRQGQGSGADPKLDDLVPLSVATSPTDHLLALLRRAGRRRSAEGGRGAPVQARGGEEVGRRPHALAARRPARKRRRALRFGLILIGHVSE